jgi:hypothetical protein
MEHNMAAVLAQQYSRSMEHNMATVLAQKMFTNYSREKAGVEA